MPRILIVDDHEVLRHGVRNVLETQNHWQVVGEATNGLDAIRLSRDLKPDAVVMDITMPGISGIEATRQITKAQPKSNVLILTMHEGTNLADESQRAGAKGLLTKSAAATELTPALQTIIAGGEYFHRPRQPVSD